jgi:hypothetical protein
MGKHTASLSGDAYSTVILHSLKHPHAYSVVGLLLGRVNDAKGHVDITEALPLFHTRPLAPMVSVALEQAYKGADEKKTDVVGVYVSDLPHDGSSAFNVSKLIAESISKKGKHSSCVLRINSDLSALASRSDSPSEIFSATVNCTIAELPSAGKATWLEKQQISLVDAEAVLSDLKQQILKVSETPLREGADPLSFIVDFDDHLENPSRKWFN